MGEEPASAFEGTAKSYRGTFISYAHEDLPLANQLARILNQRRVPVWYDEWELPPHLRGRELYRALRIAVASVDAMIVLETDTSIDRGTQKVPGWALSHSMAPPETPLSDASILASEHLFWTIYRSPERVPFKQITLQLAGGENCRVFRRRAMYTEDGIIYGVKKTRCQVPILWEDHASQASRITPSGKFIGEEVAVEARSLDSALLFLLDQLRTTPDLWARLQQTLSNTLLDVAEAREYSPSSAELWGFDEPDAEIRARASKAWAERRQPAGPRSWRQHIRSWWERRS